MAQVTVAPGWIRADETFYSLRMPAVRVRVRVHARVCFCLRCVVVEVQASLSVVTLLRLQQSLAYSLLQHKHA